MEETSNYHQKKASQSCAKSPSINDTPVEHLGGPLHRRVLQTIAPFERDICRVVVLMPLLPPDVVAVEPLLVPLGHGLRHEVDDMGLFFGLLRSAGYDCIPRAIILQEGELVVSLAVGAALRIGMRISEKLIRGRESTSTPREGTHHSIAKGIAKDELRNCAILEAQLNGVRLIGAVFLHTLGNGSSPVVAD